MERFGKDDSIVKMGVAKISKAKMIVVEISKAKLIVVVISKTLAYKRS